MMLSPLLLLLYMIRIQERDEEQPYPAQISDNNGGDRRRLKPSASARPTPSTSGCCAAVRPRGLRDGGERRRDSGGFELETFGGFESVDGTVHRFLSGLPQRSGFPSKAAGFCAKSAADCGIPPVKLLNERSTTALAGTLDPTSAGISPEMLLYERFRYCTLLTPRSGGTVPFNKFELRSKTLTCSNPPPGISPEMKLFLRLTTVRFGSKLRFLEIPRAKSIVGEVQHLEVGEVAGGEVGEIAGDLVGGEREDPELGGGGEGGGEGAVEEVGGEVEVAEVGEEEEVGGEGAEEAGAREEEADDAGNGGEVQDSVGEAGARDAVPGAGGLVVVVPVGEDA
ncbi:uncharacterized protein A4U43_C05F32410 [Asparagus officinalis]|uniref:Uncharacterized protein n=1 Tax=Asparagus officinalis TaxID=4686 RepID=A0A5P1F1K0_ASPOF|nr:uncharacterized protein A4U43_C05F32410 [Asparagus officinalis]